METIPITKMHMLHPYNYVLCSSTIWSMCCIDIFLWLLVPYTLGHGPIHEPWQNCMSWIVLKVSTHPLILMCTRRCDLCYQRCEKIFCIHLIFPSRSHIVKIFVVQCNWFCKSINTLCIGHHNLIVDIDYFGSQFIIILVHDVE